MSDPFHNQLLAEGYCPSPRSETGNHRMVCTNERREIYRCEDCGHTEDHSPPDINTELARRWRQRDPHAASLAD